jgi:hypothetical protein
VRREDAPLECGTRSTCFFPSGYTIFPQTISLFYLGTSIEKIFNEPQKKCGIKLASISDLRYALHYLDLRLID